RCRGVSSCTRAGLARRAYGSTTLDERLNLRKHLAGVAGRATPVVKDVATPVGEPTAPAVLAADDNARRPRRCGQVGMQPADEARGIELVIELEIEDLEHILDCVWGRRRD